MSHNNSNPQDDTVKNKERRKFLGIAVGVINIALIGAIVGPVLGFVASPLKRRKKGEWVAVLDDSHLAPGDVKDVSFTMRIRDGFQDVDRQYTVFLRKSDDGVVCIDPACTHLGCRVKYQSDQHRFLCPCHGGVFNQDGDVVSGPPPRPLDKHPVKVEGGKIWIYKEV
ncbi:MAG: Rieske (2Fe-2S) protein [Fimbriimonadaceae bacterium]|nr:Rieske (2Fe-2S) protein [Fimbriimonadaceae bacterium]